MSLKAKWGLLFILLIPCIGIGIAYNMDLVTYFFTARFAHYDLTRVYALNWDLGPYFYGPNLLPFLEPFGTMEYTRFKVLSMVVDTFWYLVIWFCLHELFPLLKERTTIFGWLALFILAINPFHQHYQSHQMQIFLCGLVCLAEYSRNKSKPNEFVAGFLVMFAAMTKLFPGVIVLYYLALGKKRLLQGLVAGFLLSLLLPPVYFGWANGVYLYTQFVSSLFHFNAAQLGNDPVTSPEILNLHAIVARWMPAYRSQASLIGFTLTALLIGGWWISAFRHRKELNTSRTSGIHYWAVGMALSILCFPGTRTSYFIFLLPAFAALVESYVMAPSRLGKLTIALTSSVALFGVAFTTDWVLGKHWNNQMEAWSIPTWGGLLFTLILFLSLGLLRTHRKPSDATFSV